MAAGTRGGELGLEGHDGPSVAGSRTSHGLVRTSHVARADVYDIRMRLRASGVAIDRGCPDPHLPSRRRRRCAARPRILLQRAAGPHGFRVDRGHGHVTAADGTAALARQSHPVVSAARPQSRVAVSDDDGRFAFAEVAAGSYELRVMRSGYAPVPEGQSRGARGAGRRRSSRRPASSFVLQPESVIPGRLYDEDGSPLGGAEVEALSLRASGDRQSLVPVAAARTDDRGEFRIVGLSAGQYFVVARDAAFSKAGDAAGVLRYPATFYPGGISAAAAQPISVAAGQEAARARVPRHARQAGAGQRRAACAGQAAAAERRGRAGAARRLDSRHAPGRRHRYHARTDGSRSATCRPAAYQLRARAERRLRSRWRCSAASRCRSSPGRDVEGITVNLVPGADGPGPGGMDRRTAAGRACGRCACARPSPTTPASAIR